MLRHFGGKLAQATLNPSTPVGDIHSRLAAGERNFQGETLSGVNLRGADLRGVNLRAASLRGANLHGADLREARLARADLGMADVGMADFASADLTGADFRGANLKGANFGKATLDGANLRGADMNGADLGHAQLIRADLSRADLALADLSRADMRGVDLRGAVLTGANLKDASLLGATLHGADLRGADLSGVNLRAANLTDTRLEDANLTRAAAGSTVFADLDLRQARGLETVHHASPSTVGADTLARSMGRIPEGFLRGCGLAVWEILAARQYDASLSPAEVEDLERRTLQARTRARLPRKRVLISYSAMDASFVEELRRRLLERGLYSWVAAHEDKGAVRERQSKLAIEHDLTLLLVLSQSSVQSDWVEHEMRLARKLEKATGEDVLCPVSLDDSWKASPFQTRITDKIPEDEVASFAEWSDPAKMDAALSRLLEAITPTPK